MSHFMCNGGYALVIPGIAHQNKRIGVKGSRGKSASSLSCVRVHIDPAVTKRFPNLIGIFPSQRRKPLQNKALCFLIAPGILCGKSLCQRHINIIVVQLIQAEKLFAKLYIAVHRRHMTPHALHKSVIDRSRNVLSCKSHRARALVMPCSRLRCKAFHNSGISGSQSISMRGIPLIEAAECILPQCPVSGLLQQNEVCLRQLPLISLPILHGIKRKIRIHQTVCDGFRSFQNLGKASQQLFRLCREHMRLLIEKLLKQEAIGQKLPGFCNFLQLLLRKRQNFRLRKRAAAFRKNCLVHTLRHQLLRLRCSCILRLTQHGIGQKIVHSSLKSRHRLIKLCDRLRITKLSLKGCCRIGIRVHSRKVLLKCFIIFIQRTQIPLVFGIHL